MRLFSVYVGNLTFAKQHLSLGKKIAVLIKKACILNVWMLHKEMNSMVAEDCQWKNNFVSKKKIKKKIRKKRKN